MSTAPDAEPPEPGEPGDGGSGAWPRPVTERWQPLRLGLVDLFYYDDEQFWFHDGRLLLRGNNGTGKSKVLALTLPFLLDGSVAPRRVEPDADPKKRMEWNLLLGGAHGSSERTGYSWVEFGRRDPDGVEHFTTLGIGLKAATGRGIVRTWFFVTTRRIGDLRLMDESRTALTDARLRDALGDAGQVYSTQTAYRRAVDEALFRLGPQRYDALVDLLISLRQPQLSRNPDERALSAALTEALAPLDQAVVADVAESFRSLEEERDAVADTRATLKGAEDFLKHYRDYAKVAARRRTTAVRTANSTFELAGRHLREAEEQRGAAVLDIERLDTEQAEAEQQQGALQGQEEALRSSPEMRQAANLDRHETTALDLERRADVADAESSQAQMAERQAVAEAEVAGARAETALEAQRRRHGIALGLAADAGLGDEHERMVDDDVAAKRVLARRSEQIGHLRDFAERTAKAHAQAAWRRASMDDAETLVTSRGEETESAVAAVDAAVVTHRDDVRGYLGGLLAIEVPATPDDLAAEVEHWAGSLVGDSPGRVATDQAAATGVEALTRRRAAAEQEADRAGAELADVTAQIGELEGGRDPEPPTPPGRDAADRVDAPGAPLWRLTDFADDVSAADRAGVEAALQSSGLLDAWVFPDGSVLAAHDVVLFVSGPEVPVAPEALGRLLVASPGPEAPVPAAVVSQVLARIGLGEGSGAAVWIDVEGRWGAGPARGAWAKQRAEYVGAGAREAHRQEVLAQLRSLAAELAGARDEARARQVEAELLIALVTSERSGYPAHSEREVLAGHERVAGARRELIRAQQALDAAREVYDQAQADAERSTAELAEAAGDLGLGTTVSELDAALAALADYREALAELRGAVREADTAEAALVAAGLRAAQSSARRQACGTQAGDLRMEAATARARADALRATVGATVAELQDRLRRLTADLESVAARRKALTRAQLEAAAIGARLEEKVHDLTRRREETNAVREEEVATLRSFTATGILRVALPDLAAPDPAAPDDWNLTAAVGLARTVEQRLEATDGSDEAWSRAQQRVSNAHTDLAGQMSRHGHTAVLEQQGEVMVVRVRYVHDEVDVDRLAQRLADDIEARERLLSAREREILENHLVSEIAGHMHELLLSAESQIERMNRELADRKTSTGMQLRVLWRARADGPSGLADARQLMIRSDATWTPADRTAIGDFLQARIGEVRAADPAGGWQEHLEAALDYRQWHSFVVERWQNGQWRSASGPASGGEKVLAVSVPLFAAASAHYNSASPLAPRLILLDEAFAGVDDDSRAKSLGLLATFDMDVVMTSEREWGCYPQVPGLAIAQLSRVEGVDAVGVTRWRWDGRRRENVEEVVAQARAGHGPEPTPEGSLFG